MIELLSIAALAGATAITPGPNNLIVMSAAAKHGVRRTVPSMAVIATATGGMVLLAATVMGSGIDPDLLRAIKIGGALLLAALAVGAWRGAGRGWEGGDTGVLHAGQLLGLQALNPKAWLFALTMAAAAEASSLSIWWVVQLVILTSAVSLLIWAVGGAALARRIRSDPARTSFDRGMAALLFFSALGMAATSTGIL
jgi:threonine/homoserine/homoserine lactone efflux protein